MIDKKIKEKPVFVISKSYCPFCVKAKDALKTYKIKPECIEIMEIENSADCDSIQVSLILFSPCHCLKLNQHTLFYYSSLVILLHLGLHERVD